MELLLRVLLTILALAAVAAGIYAWIHYRFFQRTTADMAFVRTGGARPLVVIGGGAPVYPWRDRVTWVYLGSTKLDIRRANRDALITRDRFRVDAAVDFYVRVEPREETVLRAAQSLGERTANPEALKDLLENELVAALRAVAAERTLDELHTNRQAFEQAVHEIAAGPLAQRGLTLERVSLAHLDQTAIDWYDQNNVFDAVGLEQITRQTAASRTARNDYERSAEITITQRNVEAHKTILQLEQDRALADHRQQSAIEEHRAESRSRTHQFVYQQEEAERRAAIERDLRVREFEILSERTIRERELEKEALLIAAEREKEKAQIEKERELGIAAWERDRAVNAARRVTSVELSEHELMMFQRMAARLKAEAEMKAAEQAVLTTEARAAAEREREIALIKALEKREVAEKEAEATERIAESILKDGRSRAGAREAMVAAENLTHDKFIARDILLALIDRAPQIARELMEPARHIDSIRILDFKAPTPAGAPAADGADAMSAAVDRVLGAIIGTGAALPLLRELLQFTGVDQRRLMELAVERIPSLKQFVESLGRDDREDGRPAA